MKTFALAGRTTDHVDHDDHDGHDDHDDHDDLEDHDDLLAMQLAMQRLGKAGGCKSFCFSILTMIRML